MAKRMYALNTGVGLFVDDETGLKVVPGMTVRIDEALAGQKTQIAIRNKALIESDEKNDKNSIKTDLPEDFPSRDVLIKEGIGVKELDQIPEDKLAAELSKIKGLNAKAVDAIIVYINK